MLKDKINTILADVLKTNDFTLLTPKDSAWGDYALHVQKIAGKEAGVAQIAELIRVLQDNKLFEKVEKRGDFINLFISQSVLLDILTTVMAQKETYGSSSELAGVRMIVEFAHPNTHKLFHIGHARNIVTGESLARILSTSGAKIIRANYQGDVGLHIAKCLWAIKKQEGKIKELKSLKDKIDFLGKCYTAGTDAYETDEKAREEIHQINQQIYAKDPQIQPLLEETRTWSLEYYDRIYKRFGTKFDRLFFESEVADEGLQIAKQALKDGVLEESDGAVVLRGDKHGVDTRVFINSLGLPTYEAKELGLGQLEFSEFGKIDQCIHVVGNDHNSYFKTAFKVQELLDPKKYQGKQKHYAYGFVNLKTEKMSSRVGNIVEGNWLIDQVKKRIHKAFKTDDQTAETLAVAAIKYGFLKVDAVKNIAFDIDESISLSGNSGPYLLYAYARCRSVLAKAGPKKLELISTDLAEWGPFQPEDLSLLRSLPRFSHVVYAAAKQLAPHYICTYLFDLARKFSLFYEKKPILKADKKVRAMRLLLTQATAQVLKNGLYLLGINALAKI